VPIAGTVTASRGVNDVGHRDVPAQNVRGITGTVVGRINVVLGWREALGPVIRAPAMYYPPRRIR
jgi:hypothetical protein